MHMMVDTWLKSLLTVSSDFKLTNLCDNAFFHVLISELFCSFWDSVWIMQAIVTDLHQFYQNLYLTSGVMMPVSGVCVILSTSLQKFVMSYLLVFQTHSEHLC